MIEKTVAITHRDHIVVEHTGINGSGILLRKHTTAIPQPVQPGNRPGCFQSLPGRIAFWRRSAFVERLPAVDKELNPRLPVAGTEAGVIGRPFVAELAH